MMRGCVPLTGLAARCALRPWAPLHGGMLTFSPLGSFWAGGWGAAAATTFGSWLGWELCGLLWFCFNVYRSHVGFLFLFSPPWNGTGYIYNTDSLRWGIADVMKTMPKKRQNVALTVVFVEIEIKQPLSWGVHWITFSFPFHFSGRQLILP